MLGVGGKDKRWFRNRAPAGSWFRKIGQLLDATWRGGAIPDEVE